MQQAPTHPRNQRSRRQAGEPVGPSPDEAAAPPGGLRDDSVRHLYVHIPFCPKVCPYCSFYKEAGSARKAPDFLDALVRELEMRAKSLPLRPATLFFGGGTPSALSVPQLDMLLERFAEILDLSALREWTIEMNPATVSLRKAALLKSHGVNRVSMGVQSWNAQLLAVLGRVHTAEEALHSHEILRAAGFASVNLDHIFGIPTQTPEQWRETLEQSIALNPEHLSAYCLTYEEDTEFMERFQRGDYHQDEEADAVFYETTMDVLEGNGYAQYEISNFARPGRECLHNLCYWKGNDYLGLGPSAFSTIQGARWQNVANTDAYVASLLADRKFPVGFRETVTPETARRERIAFGLRTRDGVPLDLLGEQTTWSHMVEGGIATLRDGRLVLTRRGRLLADAVAGELI